MLLSFGFRNFYSFREGAVVSFELDAQARKAIGSSAPVSAALCVKGANASGKTHVLKAISFLGYFVTRSFREDPDSEIAISPHFENSEPIDFFAEFISKGERFYYELSVTKNEILTEKISRRRSRLSLLLERKRNKITKCTKEWDRLNNILLRKNASIISTAKQYGFDEIESIQNFFEGILTNVTYSGLRTTIFDEYEASEIISKNKDFSDFVKQFISGCDVGITDITIAKKKEDDGKERYFPAFHHGEGMEKTITWHTESSGTRALFRELIKYKVTLDLGGILVADEFDIHLHPHILPKILNLFLDEKSNSKGAQIIFTTHNSAIMDFMGKYRTYLVQKENNESYAYRLDEIPGEILRNDRPISRLYKDGRIGGIPKL